MSKQAKKTQEATEIQNKEMNPEIQNGAQAPAEQTAAPAAPETETETEEQKSARLVREEQLKAAKEYIGHKAMYVPADDYEFYPATVVGATIDPKGTVLVALRTQDGKRVTKKYGSKLLRVLEEMAEKPVRNRTKIERVPVTEEVINQHRELIGLPCTIDELEGRVRGVQVDKRTAQIYLTIIMADGSKRHTKITNESFKVGVADEKTEEIRTAYFALLDQRAQGSKSSPERQVQLNGAAFIAAYKKLIEAGKIEETESLIACIEEVMDMAKALNAKPATEKKPAETAEDAE